MSRNWSQDKYLHAFRFAAAVHNNQKFPGTDWPYIVHTSMVCMEVKAALAEEHDHAGDLAVQCALLHDTLEDTDATYELLRGEFGQAVADGVLALTKNAALPKEARMTDSLDRILRQPAEVAMVKLADRITNLQPPPVDWTNEKRKTYLEQAREIIDALRHASPYLALRLSEKMKAYEEFLGEDR
jgi:(p)ppGpp synthase/HD superfamily hydrolase